MRSWYLAVLGAASVVTIEKLVHAVSCVGLVYDYGP